MGTVTYLPSVRDPAAPGRVKLTAALAEQIEANCFYTAGDDVQRLIEWLDAVPLHPEDAEMVVCYLSTLMQHEEE